MLAEEVIKYCAPTLAGLKTGSMFSVKADGRAVLCEIKKLNGIFAKKGLRLIPMRMTEKHTLLYLFRPGRLSADLRTKEAMEILSAKGYDCEKTGLCLAQLIKHLKEDSSFPHEIGLFLGYPPEDVRCFMNDCCEGVKCTGCWKVYGDREEALKTFERFRRCTNLYMEKAYGGKSLEELTVAEKAG